MRLDGIGFLLAFALTVAYGVIVDVALLGRIFRYRAALVGGLIVALVMIVLLVGLAASPSERAGFFNGAPGGASLVVLLMTGTVFCLSSSSHRSRSTAPCARAGAGRAGSAHGWPCRWRCFLGSSFSPTRKSIFGRRSTQQGRPWVVKPEPVHLA